MPEKSKATQISIGNAPRPRCERFSLRMLQQGTTSPILIYNQKNFVYRKEKEL